MKTSELFGAALDYAVALAEGCAFKASGYPSDPLLFAFPARPDEWLWFGMYMPSQRWDGDLIIDREKISTWWCWNFDEPEWAAEINGGSVKNATNCYGATRREAAMRCYVTAKLGDEVEIPKEIL